LLALGHREPDEPQPFYALAFLAESDERGNQHMKFLYDEQGGLPVFADGDLAHACALILGTLGIPRTCVLPAWQDYVGELVAEGTGAFVADLTTPTGPDPVPEWFALRARLLDHLASLLRRYTFAATAPEVAA
jgi:hypothetical protein